MAQRGYEKLLHDKSLLKQALPIAGKWISAAGAESFAVHNPATGEEIGRLPICGTAMVKKAIKAAETAQKSWAAKPAKARAEILQAWYRLILANKRDLGLILTLEQGKPWAEAIGEIEYGASFIEWFAEEARRINGEIIPASQADKRIMVLKQPIGVAAAITPWNFPNAMITRKAAPAFAAGCAMVLKPAKQTPFSAVALAVLAEKAGLPLALFSIVTGNSQEIGAVMTQSPVIRKLTFTGSTEIGIELYAQSAKTVKKLSLELGGNAPFIVFDDADLDAAVEGAIAAKFRNNGQTCVCANRFYVHDKIYDRFAKKLKTAVEKLRVGNGLEEGVALGPLIDKAAVEKVAGHIADAQAKGGKVILGGKPAAMGGTFFEPTILTDITAQMRVAKEETFGPVAALFRFRDEEDAVRQANNTEFGLAGYFFSRDIARIFRIAERLEYGIVGVNTGSISMAEAPFGGMKYSGIGREGSHFGIEDYVELKYVCLGGIL